MSGNIDFNFHKRCESDVVKIDDGLYAHYIRYGATAEEMGAGWFDLPHYNYLGRGGRTTRREHEKETKFFFTKAFGKEKIDGVQVGAYTNVERPQDQGGSEQGTQSIAAEITVDGDSFGNAQTEEGDLI